MNNPSPRTLENGLSPIDSPLENDLKPYQSTPKRGPLKGAIQEFGPIWFSFCMNAGILAVIMHQFPYPFPGLGVLTDIFFGVDLLFYCIFFMIALIKVILYPRQTFEQLTADPTTTCFTACIPIAWFTNTALVALIVSQASWGGHWAMLVAYVMWWTGLGMMLITTCVIYIGFMRTSLLTDEPVPLSGFIPLVGLDTAAAVGGLLASYASEESGRLAVPVIITSYIVLGIGFFGAIMMYGVWFHRFLLRGWVAPNQLPALCLLVAPMGQAATALQSLGAAAETAGRFGQYSKGTFLQQEAAQPLSVACILLALLCVGIALFWFIVALFGIFEAAFKLQFKTYSMTWYATIFPIGTLNTALLYLGVELDSPTFRVLTVALYMALLISFLVNLVFTIWGIFFGDILIPSDTRKQTEFTGEKKAR
ncbi:MAG: hypothetical protein M1820_008724 [Bogoriella megaspora]|nr:MAG: hypothetical protein M1820_008724 [Bogoriella megaspora]